MRSFGRTPSLEDLGMRMEFLAEGAADCPLILMTLQREEDVPVLTEAVRRAAKGPVGLHMLAGIEAVGGLTLVGVPSPDNLGLRASAHGGFEWALNPDGWEEVAGFLEPFMKPSNGEIHFQYLNRFGGPNVIVSTSARW